MEKFRKIYLLSYSLIFALSFGLFISTYTLLPSRAMSNRDEVSNAICHQTSRNKFGLEVVCQPSVLEPVGAIWTTNNYVFASTTIAPAVITAGILFAERRDPAGNKIEKTPWRVIGGVLLLVIYWSPHLLALGLGVHWGVSKIRQRKGLSISSS